MKVKRKAAIIVVIAILIVLLGIISYLYFSFNGSLIVKMIRTKEAKNYVAETYSGEELDVSFAVYDFKMGLYMCRVDSPKSQDTSFYVWKDRSGTVCDDYEYLVTQRGNTVTRLSQELDRYAEQELLKVLPYKTSLILCDFYSPYEDADRAKLELDMPLDVKALPHPAELTVWLETQNDKPSWDELAVRLREIEKLMRDIVPDTEYYSLNIQKRYALVGDEVVSNTSDDDVSVYGVPRSVITGDGLEAWLAEEKAKQDAEKEAVNNGDSSIAPTAADDGK